MDKNEDLQTIERIERLKRTLEQASDDLVEVRSVKNSDFIGSKENAEITGKLIELQALVERLRVEKIKAAYDRGLLCFTESAVWSTPL